MITSPARLALCAAIAATIACGRSEDVPDDKLGGLVVPEAKQSDTRIDLDKAAKDPDELARALAQPHRKAVEALGPHVAKVASSSEITGQPALTEAAMLELGDKGTFHGVYTNSADYGREAIFVEGKLYLRPRYQRWHGRAPESPDEPAAVRDAYWEAVFATWDLLSPGAQLTDRGPVQIEGRVGRKIEITQASRPREPAKEALAQRRWRQSRTVDGVTGEIVLDKEKAVVLSAKLSGNVAFQKDGTRYSMKVTLDASIGSIGTPVAIGPPPTGEVVATPERLREVDDRDYLLQNIAPPLRRNPDGTAATPQVTPAAPGSGAAAEPPKPDKAEKKSKSDDKKSEDKKSDDKKSEDKKPDDTKPEAKP